MATAVKCSTSQCAVPSSLHPSTVAINQMFTNMYVHYDQTHVHSLCYLSVMVNHMVKVTVALEGNTASFRAEMKTNTLRCS
jgi:hypothetical protein